MKETDGGALAPNASESGRKLPKDAGAHPSGFGLRDHKRVTSVEKASSKVVSSVPRAEQLAKHGKNANERQKDDTDEYANFRERMKDEGYQVMYKQRPSIAEFPNAYVATGAFCNSMCEAW